MTERHAMDESLLSAYLDGELDADERAAVEARLAESAEWRRILDDVRGTRELLRGLPWRDAPAGFWDGVLRADDRVVALDRARARRGRAARWASVAAGAAAAAAILGVVLVPGQDRIKPKLATVTDAHAVRSSFGNDVVSNLAGAAVDEGPGR